MSFTGKLHEITFYSLLATILCMVIGDVSLAYFWEVAFEINSINTFFLCVFFWGAVAFIPVSILCAFVVKYYYDGEGLLFDSDSILVIIFGHIPEEFLGLILTPIWFVKDIVTKNFNGWKILDYCLYWMEIIFFGIGLLVCL